MYLRKSLVCACSLGWLLLMAALGCTPSPPAAPPPAAPQLPGTWLSPQDGFNITWTMAADGQVRLQLDHQQAIPALLTGGVDISGYWRREGDRLHLQLRELPPNPDIFGGRWTGFNLTLQIDQLTAGQLSFRDSPLRFYRVSP